MFLSLKKHWESSSAELTALLQLSQQLFRSMRLHVVRGEETEVQRFQSALLVLEQRVATVPEASEILLVAGESARTFQEYCHHTNRYLQVQRGQLAGMMGMLTATVTSISTASQTAVDQLGKVERRIEQLSVSTDLLNLKMDLSDCLTMVREEAYRQREQNDLTVHALQRGVSDARQRIAEVTTAVPGTGKEPLMRDLLTNLPGRADAEDALVQARGRKNMYAAVLPVDRLSLVNSRFGTQAADGVIKFFAEYLQKHLKEEDSLFRWSGHSFLALVERGQTQDSVRADLARFAAAKLELTLEHHGREIRLRVSSTWALFEMAEGQTHDALAAKIDGFLKGEMHVKESF